MRKLLLVILSAGCMVSAFAQTETSSAEIKKEKQTEQFIGVQLNPLIRQILNFNNSTTSPIVSGYLVTYNINMTKTGWGLRLGVGVNYNTSWNNDGITEVSNNISHTQGRIGIEKAYKLGGKWTTGIGLDVIANLNDNHTISTVRQIDTIVTDTKSKSSTYGGGAMGWLRYNITSHIVLGTETSFYYTTGKEDNVTDVTQRDRTFGGSSGQITTTETKAKPTTSNTAIQLPVVFYIIVRF